MKSVYKKWFGKSKKFTESNICKESDFDRYKKSIAMLPKLQQVYPKFNIPEDIVHRKVWEWAFIIDVLKKYGMLSSGMRGVGFAVGNEPLPSIFSGGGVKFWLLTTGMKKIIRGCGQDKT